MREKAPALPSLGKACLCIQGGPIPGCLYDPRVYACTFSGLHHLERLHQMQKAQSHPQGCSYLDSSMSRRKLWSWMILWRGTLDNWVWSQELDIDYRRKELPVEWFLFNNKVFTAANVLLVCRLFPLLHYVKWRKNMERSVLKIYKEIFRMMCIATAGLCITIKAPG